MATLRHFINRDFVEEICTRRDGTGIMTKSENSRQSKVAKTLNKISHN